MANVSSSNGLENRPKLRFPGFDEPWKATAFGDIVHEFSNRTKVEDEDVLLSAAIEGMFLNTELFGHQRGASNKGYKKIKYGTMVLSTQNLHLGNANVNQRFEHGMVSPAYKTYDISGCSIDLIAQWIKSDAAKRFFYNATTVGASVCRRNVEWDTLYEQSLFLPSLPEQEKIANLLTLLSNRIEKQRQLIIALKKYKRGLLSNAFRNASSWRKKRLGEICCIRTGKLDANAMVNDGKYPFFTCARERYSIDTYAFDTDALLISGNGANVGYIHHYTGKFNAYQRTYVLDQFQEDINYVHVFLNRFLSSRIDAEKKAGNTPYIVLSTLSDMEIYIPDETTTKQLVDLFTQIENRISYSATVLEYLSSQRRGLLQQLFI